MAKQEQKPTKIHAQEQNLYFKEKHEILHFQEQNLH